jgi:hypothetical protein
LAAALSLGAVVGTASDAAAGRSPPRIVAAKLSRAILPASGGAVVLKVQVAGASTCWFTAARAVSLDRRHQRCGGGSARAVLRMKVSDSLKTTRETVVAWAQDSAGKRVTRRVVFNERAHAPLVVTIRTSQALKVGATFSGQLVAVKGHAPYHWELVSGQLPPGLAMSASGAVKGTPHAQGTFLSVVKVSDSSRPHPFTLTVQLRFPVSTSPSSLPPPTPVAPAGSSLALTTPSLPAAVVGQPYSASLGASGGTPPYTWSLISGSLPPGIGLGSGGSLSGTPTTAGTYSAFVQVSDTSSPTQTASETVGISVTSSALAVTTVLVPQGTVGVAYTTSLAASGGVTPYTWSVTGCSLPQGLTLSSDGTISGTPTAAESVTCTVQVTDSASPADTATAAITVTIVSPVLTITSTATALTATANTSFRFPLGVTGGVAPYTWLVSGPPWVSIAGSGTTAVLSGTAPSLSGSGPSPYSITIGVSDSSSPVEFAQKQVTLSVFS